MAFAKRRDRRRIEPFGPAAVAPGIEQGKLQALESGQKGRGFSGFGARRIGVDRIIAVRRPGIQTVKTGRHLGDETRIAVAPVARVAHQFAQACFGGVRVTRSGVGGIGLFGRELQIVFFDQRGQDVPHLAAERLGEQFRHARRDRRVQFGAFFLRQVGRERRSDLRHDVLCMVLFHYLGPYLI